MVVKAAMPSSMSMSIPGRVDRHPTLDLMMTRNEKRPSQMPGRWSRRVPPMVNAASGALRETTVSSVQVKRACVAYRHLKQSIAEPNSVPALAVA